ncbi:MAG: hypothetical protein Q4B04_00325 [bacterium]|nr:hypothetical protein [bacterium]
MVKRLFALVLVLVLALSVSACGGTKLASLEDDPDKKVELVWATTHLGHQDDEIVWKQFNKNLQKLLPNTTVDFIELNAENWSNWMAAKKQIDIAWTGYSFDMKSLITNRSYLGLNKLIDMYAPNIQAEREEWVDAYYSGTVDGELYAIPNQQPLLKQSVGLEIPYSCYDSFDVDAFLSEAHNNYHTTQKMIDLLDSYMAELHAKKLVDTDTVGWNPETSVFYALVNRGYESVSDLLSYDVWTDDVKVIANYELPQEKMVQKLLQSWYQKGWLKADYVTTGNNINGSRKAPINFTLTNNWIQADERGIKVNMDKYGEPESYTLYLDKIEQGYNGVSTIGSEATYLAIPFTSHNPGRAIKLIDLLRSERGTEANDLLNLLVYGFEKDSEYAAEYGTYHYTLGDGTEENADCAYGVDYTIQADSNCIYGIPHWVVGNVYLTYRTPNIVSGQVEDALNYQLNVKPTLRKTPLYKFRPDTSKLGDLIANIENARSNAGKLTTKNDAEFETTYEKMIKDCETAGMTEYKENIQKQVDEYIAANSDAAA